MASDTDYDSDGMRGNGDGGLSEGNGRRRKHPFMTWRNNLRALVVDNARTCRIMESGLLDAYGVEVEAVGTGEAAVELIASGETFDLIVLEMFLPFMSGPETARTIREMGISCKILGIAPMYCKKDAQEFLAAGIDEFLEKPFTPELFIPFLMEIDNQK
ncbi:hypothetical protein I3842_04G107700 [Carya illinoinensis]|uniref:Response regulatory domain-containing protein n=1 Tax=Carya illinoinensis TaxID=32201 RepID=A0A922F7U8_CARIL|nr:hypothetical protein I3842_04G107700 [Carya illinoinensis]